MRQREVIRSHLLQEPNGIHQTPCGEQVPDLVICLVRRQLAYTGPDIDLNLLSGQE
jgi:hypothetical protein